MSDVNSTSEVNIVVAELMERMIDLYGHERLDAQESVDRLIADIGALPKELLLQAFKALGEVAFDLAAELGRERGDIDAARPIIQHVASY